MEIFFHDIHYKIKYICIEIQSSKSTDSFAHGNGKRQLICILLEQQELGQRGSVRDTRDDIERAYRYSRSSSGLHLKGDTVALWLYNAYECSRIPMLIMAYDA